MLKIQLTQGKFALVDDEDYDFLNQFKWFYAKHHSGSGYAVRGFPKRLRMHREIMNAPTNFEVDHINGDKLDNRKENLRLVNDEQQAQNARVRKDNKSGIKGVSWHNYSQKWHAQINIKGKRTSLGYFFDKEIASQVYEQASKLYFGKYERKII